MNRSSLIPAGLLCLGFLATISAQEVPPKPLLRQNAPGPAHPGPAVSAPAPAAAAPAFSDDQILESLGWMIGNRFHMDEYGFTQDEVNLIAKGLLASTTGEKQPCDPQKITPYLAAFMRTRQRNENLRRTNAFFEKLKEDKQVVELPSGLRYEILQPGSGTCPIATDTVKVNYTGKLLNDTVFDSSAKRGQPSVLSLNRVIPGWTEGLQKIKQGGKIRLFVPPDLAYGDAGHPGIPPASALIFDIELIEVNPAPPAPLKPLAPVAPAPLTPPIMKAAPTPGTPAPPPASPAPKN